MATRFGIESHRYQTLQAACEAWDLSQLARRALSKGLSYKDAKGQWRARPEVAIARDARTAYLRAVKELKIDMSPPSSPTQKPLLPLGIEKTRNWLGPHKQPHWEGA